MHTFGVGNGADETLIKNCASKGFGNFYFIYNEDEIEEKVISSLTKMRLNYQVLQSIKLFDKDGQQVETNWLQEAIEPLINDNAIQLLELLPQGKVASKFEVEILDLNQNKVEVQAGDIV